MPFVPLAHIISYAWVSFNEAADMPAWAPFVRYAEGIWLVLLMAPGEQVSTHGCALQCFLHAEFYSNARLGKVFSY